MAAGATYEPIATQTLASAASSITFSSIAASWTDLRLVFVDKGATGSPFAIMQYNGDTATNYSYTDLYGSGTAAGSARATSSARIAINDWGNPTTTIPQLSNIDIFSYAGSTFKTCLINTSNDNNGSGYTENRVGLWRSTAAITSIVLTASSGGNFAIGTTATLYGIKAA